DTVPQVDVLDGDVVDPARLVLLHDGLAGGEDAFGVRVALGRRQIQHDVLQNLIRRLEAKRCRVADIELEDADPFVFHPLGFFQDGTANVVTNVGKLVGLGDDGHWRRSYRAL